MKSHKKGLFAASVRIWTNTRPHIVTGVFGAFLKEIRVCIGELVIHGLTTIDRKGKARAFARVDYAADYVAG